MRDFAGGGGRSPWMMVGRFVAAEALVAIAILVALGLAARWGSASADMLFLPAVLAAAIWLGFGPALLAAISAALAYNYFFTAPLHTLWISSAADVVDVTVLFLVALVTSRLVAAIRRESVRAEAHAQRNATIAGFARRLLSAGSEAEIAQAACTEAGAIFHCNALILSGALQPVVLGAAPAGVRTTPADLAAALHTLGSGEPAGHLTARLGPADWTFFPIGAAAGSTPLAALGLARDDGAAPVGEDRALLLDSLLDQTALALTRARGEAAPALAAAV